MSNLPKGPRYAAADEARPRLRVRWRPRTNVWLR